MGSTPEWTIYWGPQDEGEAIRAIHAAIDEGINWIDTAPFYGWGRAEEIVGRAIRGRRDRLYVFTKCGTMNNGSGGDYMDLSPGAIRDGLEASLRRLGLDHVDLFQPHDPDPSVPIEDSWGEVQRLIDAGKVRHGGLSWDRWSRCSTSTTCCPAAWNARCFRSVVLTTSACFPGARWRKGC